MLAIPSTFDLARLGDDDLHRIIAWTTEHFLSHPAFTQWALDLLEPELRRRRAAEGPQKPVNVTPPQDWADGQLGAALAAGATLSHYARDITPAAGEFLDLVLLHLACFAAARLIDRHAIAEQIVSN